jgi:hypothetical protein
MRGLNLPGPRTKPTLVSPGCLPLVGQPWVAAAVKPIAAVTLSPLVAQVQAGFLCGGGVRAPGGAP